MNALIVEPKMLILMLVLVTITALSADMSGEKAMESIPGLLAST